MPSFLGIDIGSSAAKFAVLSESPTGVLSQTHSATVAYTSLAHGPAILFSGATATSSPYLFLAALEAGLDSLAASGAPLASLAALSGSAQMHASVYTTAAFAGNLASLAPSAPLSSLAASSFAFARVPTWLDTSTAAACAGLEDALGGAAALSALTGSRAYERFTGPQVRKRSREAAFANTARVHLLSSFLASIFAGAHVSVDVGDASGTNMFDVTSVPPAWAGEAVAACGAAAVLCPAPVEGWTVVGAVSEYFSERFGIGREAVVCAFSGDNPCTIASYGGLGEGDLVVSLGTSDTAQWASSDGRGREIGHTFRSPLGGETPEYFRLLCYANGSQTREAVRDGVYGIGGEVEKVASWEEWDDAIAGSAADEEDAKVALFFRLPEIVPRTNAEPHAHVFRTGDGGGGVCRVKEALAWPELCRLAAESRALSIAVDGAVLEGVGRDFAPRRILFAGGGSASRAMQEIFADVFGVPVFAFAGSSSAAAGAARRAHHCERIRRAGKFIPFASKAGGVADKDLHLLASPNEKLKKVYELKKNLYGKACEEYSSREIK